MYRNLLAELSEKYFSANNTAANIILIAGIVFCIAVGYLLGSLNFGLIISGRFYHDDVREHGSGNAGTTNMMRTYGMLPAAITMVGDFLKSALSVVIGGLLLGLFGGYLAGFAAVIGHVFPLYYGFKGGKGVMTVAGVMALTDWRVFLVLFVIFLLSILCTKMVSFGSVLTAVLYPIILFNILKITNSASGSFIGVVFAVLMAATVVIKHKENIKRILAGKESKMSLFDKKKKDGDEGKK